MWRKPTWSSRLHSWITRPIATRWTWFAGESFPRSESGIDNPPRLWARVEKCWPHRRDDRNPSLTPELFAKANGRTPGGRPFFALCAFSDLGSADLRLGGRQRLQAGVEAALVAGDGVGVENALLHALVQSGDGFAKLRLGGLDIALGQRLPQKAKAAAHAAAVGAVHRGAGFGLTGAFQRRYMVCHSYSLIS